MSRLFNSRYKIGEMIGTGGMADVYVAEDTRLNRKVAVKILRSDLARDPAFVARFKKEALAAGSLSHPGIVAVYDSGIDGEDSYIVMELVSGHTLRDILQSNNSMPESKALDIACQILEALDYSHSKGIVHRDIKPGNIMMTDSGQVKVMDFGIARAMDDYGATMTNTFNVVGTAQYLSPEQATGEPADQRSDIYSVGCLLYELLTGRPPFSGDTPVSIAFQHVSAPLIAPSEINPAIDESLDTVLKVALSKDPSHRYQDAGAMLDDLRRAIRGEQVTTKIRRVKPKRNYLVAGISLFAVLALVVAGLSFSGKKSATFELPNVVGLTVDQAKALLPNYTINLQQAPDSRIPEGRIASQLPLASTRVMRGSSVTLTLSQGPGNTTVPASIIGQTLINAQAIISAAGLFVSQTTPVDSSQPPGTVLAVTPTPGSVLPAGSPIQLQISSGSLQVPSLVGLTGIQALATLTEAGFLVKTVNAYDPTQPIGNVLAQAPAAGTTQNIGSSVAITVNTQPNG
jgi:serine/threonine-protein kinase